MSSHRARVAGRRARVALAVGLLTGGLAGCAGPTSDLPILTTAANGAAEQTPATVHKPDGPGPFPAVVIGLEPQSSGAPTRWAQELVARGYVVMIPDSFTTRGRANGVCTDASPGRVSVAPVHRVRDAYATLAYARSLPYVDGHHVGLMGGSHGGTTTLHSMAAPESERDPLAREKREGFAAAVALYPSCRVPLGGWRADGTGAYRSVAPLLILIGDADDWTPAEPCRKLAESAPAATPPVDITVYPSAHHSFDSDRLVRYVAARVNMSAPGSRGATTGGHPQAWADSIRRVAAFFGQHLR
jgi:dienelactone hydrolase